MSRVSDISRQYYRALTHSQAEYEALYAERAANAEAFHEAFFHRLVCPFHERFENERIRARLHEKLERTFGTDRLHFVAVDGTCQREQFADFITFYGGAYGARGEVDLLDGSRPSIRYKRWSMDHDVSMVAWVPVPYARLEEVDPAGEDFVATADERVDLSSIHHKVMQLAELFLAYNTITSSRLDAPHVLLLDLSPSSVLAATSRAQEGIGLEGYPYDRRGLTAADITVAVAQPFCDRLGIPSPKKMDLYRVLLHALWKAPQDPIDLKAIAAGQHLDLVALRSAAGYLVRRGVLSHHGPNQYRPTVDVRASWGYTKHLLQNICSRLFLEKDPTALQYDAPDADGVLRRRWLAMDDLSFLVAVAMRMLIEACWERNVLMYGVVKDSASRYLTRNYMGVAMELGKYPDLTDLHVKPLPWTDRLFCETLPHIDETIEAPWATIEFDSAFMTLHRGQAPGGHTHIGGVMGRYVNQEKLFARSLGQFFLRRGRATPLMGHVVFLERLLSPLWDGIGGDNAPDVWPIETDELGRLEVFAWPDCSHVNVGQWVMMYLLSVLTPNHYAEAIGYPDPLHKADWGAKTVGRSVANLIKSSTQFLRANPLSRTFRTTRDRAGR